jgi:hypothetical protein
MSIGVFVPIVPIKSAWGKCTDLSEIRFRNRGRPTTPNWDDQQRVLVALRMNVNLHDVLR